MPKYLDLFAGAGGLSEGFIRAGYEPIAHVEMDAAACYTLRTRTAYHWLKKGNNLAPYTKYLAGDIPRKDFYALVPKEILDSVLNYEISEESLPAIFKDIDSLLGGEKLDLIVGGPPCQAYSIAGRSRSECKMVGDKRNYLYRLYAEFLKKYQPKYFVFENVLGLLSARDEDGSLHFDNMRALFKKCGYATDFRILNASDYGVLQNRKRIILIGFHGEKADFYPQIPVVKDAHKVGELFCDLPSIKAGEGVITPVKTTHYTGKYLFSARIKEYDGEPVTFHQARPNTAQDLEIYRIVVDTWNKSKTRVSYTDLPERLRTHNNTKSFLDRFKVVAGNLPYTKPEELVRKYLFSQGFRYRKNDARLPGKPDIVLPKYKTVIFVNGCFWHGHEGCHYFVWPKNNAEFWKKKIGSNIERDAKNRALLAKLGWNVIVVWECELKRSTAEETLNLLVHCIVQRQSYGNSN